ncbi:hypothetical protein GQX73_g5752 [Xylaria multiplex]|uniref:Uncharacterized protein n=1 Tax=Xylaria multiplex TaxID=323545 RepID=A0A7C8MTS8_9PEZI|nr:hypothetical protein GQX73_g5752 [Xylaria multiplex]
MSTDLNSTGQYPVYVGTWTNWTRGRVLGATLTLRRRDADLLIAFTAFFIAFVATRVWRLICFAIHRSCSKETPQNTIYHQHQAILRNSSTPEDGIRLLSYVLWVGKSSTGLFLPLSTIAVATICIFSFTIAGGFSSYISTAIGDEVLIKSMNCGILAYANVTAQNFRSGAYYAEQITSAANYAQQCYSRGGGGLLDCNRFVTKQIIGNVDRHAACPFRSDLCRHNSSNIRIDSGYLSSYDHFGLNTSPDRRLLWRHVYHCAPMATTGYTSQINTSSGELTVYHYGNSTYTNGSYDYIYAAKSIETQYSSVWSDVSNVGYSNLDLQTHFAAVRNRKVLSQSSYTPSDSLFRDDADIDIHFLSGNGVTFARPENDLWYQVAATPTNILYTTVNTSSSHPMYIPLEPSSPLGCISQNQFCRSISGTRKCGPLASVRDAVAGAAGLFDTNYADCLARNATSSAAIHFTYFSLVVTGSIVPAITITLGPTSLLSQRYLSQGLQYYLEPDQWQLDVGHWWDISMAARQALFLSSAYGPTDPDLLADHINYTTPGLKKLCDNQSRYPHSYMKKKGYKKYEHLEWTSNATLQLQRLAQEEAGFGTWSKCVETVPGTEANEVLGSLDITNPDHPVLQSSSPRQSVPNDSQTSLEVLNTTQGSVQTDEASSPTVTPGTLSLHSIHPTAPHEGGAESSQTHKLTPNSEATVELQDSGNTEPTHGEQRARLG